MVDCWMYISKKMKRGVSILSVRNSMFKLFLPHAAKIKELEWQGNLAAQEDPIWSEWVIPLQKFPFGFRMERGRPAQEHDYSLVRSLIMNKLAELNAQDRMVKAKELLQPVAPLLNEYLGLKKKRERLIGSLDCLFLPVSSSHGDLHMGNVVFISNQVRLIDWGFYRSRSSLVLDIMHFDIRRICAKHAMSWTKAVFVRTKYIHEIAALMETSAFNLVLLYSIDRISREMEQKSDLRHINISKYRELLNRLSQERDTCFD